MATLTPNFGLTVLNPATDTLAANGYAHVTRDVQVVDAALALGRSHEHTGASAAVADPTTAPVLALDTTQGNLSGGTTYYYRYTLVDQYGNETVGSSVANVSTPTIISPPLAPSVFSAETGGTLQGGLYFYALTHYTVTNNQETTLGPPIGINISFATATNEVTLTLPDPLPAGADGFNVYRRAPGEATYNYLASVDMTVATPPSEYIDDGATNPNCSRQPPQRNVTNQTNSVLVTFPGATPTVPLDVTWRIYRSTIGGIWNQTLLHNVIEETFTGSGVISPQFLDLGLGTRGGSPPLSSNIIAQPGPITLTDAYETEGTLPVGLNIVPHEITFSYGGPLAVTTGTSVWRCPFDKAQIQGVSATLGRGFAPASTNVIVDLNYSNDGATPVWTTMYTTQGNRPTVVVGNQIGDETVPDIVDLTKGDLISIDIDQTGGGATPNDEDLIVTVYMYVQSGSLTTSVTLP